MQHISYLTECAVAFLHDFDPAGAHNLVAIHPDTRAIEGRTFPAGATDDMAAWIERHSGGRNLYFSVNEPGPDAPHNKLKKEHIGAIRAVYTDIDPKGGDFAAEKDRLAEAARSSDATIAIDSGGGIQLFWKLADKVSTTDGFEWAEACNRRAARDFGGDHTWDVNRIMRLPFTMNVLDPKKRAAGREPTLATVLRANGKTWPREAVEQAFPPLPLDRSSASTDKSDEVRAAIAEIKASRFDTYSDFDDLPAELRRKMNALLQSSEDARALWHGEGAGSEHRFALAALLKGKGFTVGEYAPLAHVWHRSTSKPDRPDARQLARDWTRSWTDLDAADEFDDPFNEGKPEAARAERKRRPDDAPFSIGEARARLAETPASEPLIEGIMNRGTFVTVIGPQKSGKTFNIMDMCAHIATGRPWCGREVAQGVTLHILCEGGKDSTLNRVEALRKAKDIPDDAPMYVWRMRADLFNSADDTKRIIEMAKELAAKHGVPIQAIPIDTLAKAMPGGDENSVKDVSKVIDRIMRIVEETGAAVFLAHHTAKHDNSQARGSSALPGAIDAELLLKDKSKIILQNLRDFDEDQAPIPYYLEQVQAGVDAKGRPINTAIVRYPINDFDDLDDVTAGDGIDAVRNMFASGDYREDERSPFWGGVAVAEAMGFDIGSQSAKERTAQQNAARTKARDILQKWLRSGEIRMETRLDAHRKPKKFYSPGVAAVAAVTTAAPLPQTAASALAPVAAVSPTPVGGEPALVPQPEHKKDQMTAAEKHPPSGPLGFG